MSFTGKVAAITGAGSGIGRALAIRLAKEGCHVALADVDDAGLQETETEISAHNIRCVTTKLDVSDRAAVEAWSNDVVSEFGAVDYIFNNAGVALFDTAESDDYDNIRWVMDINFWGMVYGSKAFLKHFREAGSGHVINVSSLFGLIAFPGQSAYNASKFAIRGYTEALAMELKGSGIYASSVHPGGILTDIARNSRYTKSSFEGGSKEKTVVEFDRMVKTTAEDAADVILKGVKGKKQRILIGKDAKILDFIQRIMPVGYSKLLFKILK